MARQILSLLICLAAAVGSIASDSAAAPYFSGPAFLWSSDSQIVIPSKDDLVANLDENFQVVIDFITAHPDAVAAVFVDERLTASRASTSYAELAAIASHAPLFKSWQFSKAFLIDDFLVTKDERVSLMENGDLVPMSGRVLVANISDESHPGQAISKFMNSLEGRPYIAIVAAPARDLDAKRALQEGEEQEQEPYINLQRHDLPAAFVMLIFAGILFVGFRCLLDVDTPDMFEDKVLVINKEY